MGLVVLGSSQLRHHHECAEWCEGPLGAAQRARPSARSLALEATDALAKSGHQPTNNNNKKKTNEAQQTASKPALRVVTRSYPTAPKGSATSTLSYLPSEG